MASVLKKLPHPNFSGPSHQYQQVPLDAESDSEDDEALLYAAPALNHHDRDGNSKQQDVSFGVGLYDHSRDLDLPRIVQLPNKGGKNRLRGANGAGLRVIRSKAFACVFVILSCLLVALIAAFAVLVAGNWDYFSPSSNSTLTSECSPVPAGSEQKPPCPTGGETEPTQIVVPATISKLNEPPTDHNEEGNTGEHNDASVSVETKPPAQDAIPTTTLSASTLATSMENKLSPATSPSEDLATGEKSIHQSSTASEETASPLPNHDAGENAISTKLHTASIETTAAPPSDAGKPSAMPTTKSGPSVNVEIITEKEEEPTTLCTTVPSPLTHSPSAATVQPSLDPTPILDNGQHHAMAGDHHVAAIQTEPADTAATTAALDVQTPTHTTSESSGSKHEEDGLPQNLERVFDQGFSHSSNSRFYWERNFFPAISEASPRAVDLNHDGTDERLVITDVGISEVTVYALNGRDGSTIWNQTVNFPVFGLRCFEDVNEDGDLDCFVSGRGGGFGALSGRDGRILWFVDQTIVYPRYNFYFPLRVPDLNGDGVDDLVNTHGGDTVYQPENHERSPGFIVVVSGKTGQKLMDPILMPDGRETYMSPVMYGSGDSGIILFGSGGETVPGSLWGLTLGSLRGVVSAYQKNPYMIRLENDIHPWTISPFTFPRPKMDYNRFDVNGTSGRSAHENCPTWDGKQVPIWNYYDLCLYEFVRSDTKGMILPPVIVDVTVDGVDDLIVSTFDGHTIALDGRDFKRRVWDAFFPGTESYSLPAPLFYTPDNIPDFLIRSSLGEWSSGYKWSSLFVLDGSNGAVVWSFNTSNMGMMSTISFMSQTHGKDAVIFFTVDADYEIMAVGDGDHKGAEAGDGGGSKAGANPAPSAVANGRRKRHNQQEEQQFGKDDNFQPPPFGEAEEEYGGEEDNEEMPEDSIDYSDDRIKQSLTHRDPPQLWQRNGANDLLPYPLTRRAYLRYCGVTTGSLYMVNREMAESGMEIKPLAQYRPYIYFAPGSSPLVAEHSISKRHVGGMPHHPSSPQGGMDPPNGAGGGSPDHMSDNMQDTLRASRCGHVLYPNSVVGTPLIADLNGDGHQDITYDVVWSAGNMAAPPLMTIVGADLEEMFESAYGKGILDFSSFVAPREQPWSQYMGRDADNKYRPPHLSKS